METETPLDARLNVVRVDIAAVERRLGIDGADPTKPEGAVKYLNLGSEELNLMTAEELGVASVALANLAFHLQNEFAMHAADAKRFFAASRRMVSRTVASWTGYQSEERVLAAIQANPDAARLDRLACDAQHKADRIAFLAKQAEFAAQMMSRLSAGRRNARGYGD